ncbi:MAG: hypothetical protein KF812_00335 [Fimbriimonadaceae bacterium]|nr:hypothetical protein [Fimbriimonadaceae bacterium]
MSRLEFALDAAWEAARSTLELFRAGVNVELKNDATPVTEADRRAEELIRAAIEKRYPGETVLGEEQGLIGANDDRWVIDPIDGTKSFVAGVPLYSTLLSYEVAGEPELGIAIFPALNMAFWAERGKGAFMDGKACRVRDESVPARALIACGGHSSLVKRGRMQGVLRLSESALATRTWGDAYGHCLVAGGQIDAMIDPTVSRWDISSVSLIVREAGGVFTDFAGQPQLSDEAISVTPAFEQWVREAFQP